MVKFSKLCSESLDGDTVLPVTRQNCESRLTPSRSAPPAFVDTVIIISSLIIIVIFYSSLFVNFVFNLWNLY